MSLNNFSRGLFATAAATGDRQMPLHLGKRPGAAVDDLADLAIADGMTQANVHGSKVSSKALARAMDAMLDTNANDCQLMDCLTGQGRTGSDLTVAAVTAFTQPSRRSD